MQWDSWRLLSLVMLAGFVGLILDQLMTFMFFTVLAYTLWLQYQWFKLKDWLTKPKQHNPPSADGVIDDVCQLIEQMQSKNSSRKKRLTGYLNRFQTATAALPDAIVVLGPDGDIQWANQAASELLAVLWPRDSGLRIHDLLRDPAFHKLLQQSAQRVVSTTVNSPVDGQIQLEVKLVDYTHENRLMIARDITQMVKLQQMRRDFVANVSHELRTPLTVLRGYLESLDADSDNALWQQALPVMQHQTQRMHLMIKDLLALSQLETGEKPLHHRPTDACEMLRSVMEDARRLETFRDQQLTLNCTSPKWLLADADELHSAISNLVFNAVKYTPAGSDIVLSWSVGETTCVIAVKDNGEGIASHHLDRLTERFYRVDTGRDREAGGTGLGLAIVKHVISRHKGQLDIVSELGEGATFSCVFPAAQCIDAPEV